MWYVYNENDLVISKSNEEPTESEYSYAYMQEDVDLDIYNVYVGLVQEINGVMTITFVTKSIKTTYELASKVKEQNEVIATQQQQLDNMQQVLDYLVMQ